MLKIKTKTLCILLLSIVFLATVSIYFFSYAEKLNKASMDATTDKEIAEHISLNSSNVNKSLLLYATAEKNELPALKTETEYYLIMLENDIDSLESKADSAYAPKAKDRNEEFKRVKNKVIELKNEQVSEMEKLESLKAEMKKKRYDMINNIPNQSEKINLDVARLGYYEKEFIFQYKDKAHADLWVASMDEIENDLKNEKFDLSLSDLNIYREKANNIIEIIYKIKELEINKNYYLKISQQDYLELNLVSTSLSNETNKKLGAIVEKTHQQKQILFLLMFSYFIISILVAFRITKEITSSLEKLVGAAKDIASGNYDKKTLIKSEDEFGYLAGAFNQMAGSIEKSRNDMRDERDKMKSILLSMSEGLLVVNKENKIILANNAASNLLKYPLSGLINKKMEKNIKFFINAKEVPLKEWPINKVLSTGKSLNIKPEDNYFIRTNDGTVFPTEFTIEPLLDSKDNGAVIIFRNITEIKLIEEEREFSRRNLESVLKSVYVERDNAQEEKNKLRAILNSIGDAVMATDEEKRIIAFNPIAEKVTGFSFEKMENRPYYKFIKIIEEETKKERRDIIDRALEKGEGSETSNLAILDIKKNKILIDMNIAPIKNSKGENTGSILVFRDVTLKREAERMRTDFISIVSHQLRTPLTAMKWFIEILLDEDVGGIKPKQKDVLKEIQDSNQGMISFVNQMLNVSRIESRRLAVNPQKINLNKTVIGLVKEIEPLLKEKKQIFSYKHLADKNMEIVTDKNLLRNILNSLILNSSRYAPRGGSIELEINKKDNKFVLFKIKDNGIGIPENEQNKIFKKFSRASNAIKYEANGTGLGLYIVKSIINMACGKIWFDSQENKGTTFYFTLPIENMVCEISESKDYKSIV